ncbi:unnamed protein product [Somion occarium]
MPRGTSTAQPNAQAQQDANSEGIDAYDLPRSLVTRIARSALPDNVKLQKETVLALLKGSTVFVNYIAATAHDVAASKQHKSVSASDVLKALELTQFGDMVDKLQEELKAYREIQKSGRSAKGPSAASSAKGKGKEAASISAALAPPAVNGKGKEKAVPGPTITIPGASSRTPVDSEPLPPEDEDDEAGVTMIQGDDDEEMGEPDDEVVEEEDEVEEDVEDEDEDEGEEVEDPIALEEEELHRDARTLDDPHGRGIHDDMEP